MSYSTVDSDGDGTDDCVEITDCDESATEVEIPSEIDGLPVTSIESSAFSGCTSLASITISDSVTSIGSSTFSSCSSLESITIPDSVTLIGGSAFSGCSSLESITIPDSVTLIGSYAFDGTALINNQTGVKYADTWVVDCDVDVTSAEIKAGTRGIAAFAFEGCSSLKSITIPDSVPSIGGFAFHACGLENITIPESVTSIGDYAFSFCGSLENITIPDSVTLIGEHAFSCSGLESITIPDSVTSIGSAFVYCDSLESITFLNPECEIYDSGAIISETATIYGYENSTAQAYAEKYGRNFEIITESEFIHGDISGNGAIDLYDAIEICKNIMGMRTFTDEEKAIADFNGDGVVDLYDAIDIAKTLLPK